MTAWPDAPAVLDFLRRASRRLMVIDAAHGATAGLALALVILLAGWPGRDTIALTVAVGALLAAAGVAIVTVLARTRRAPIAHLVEQRAPGCRNVVITADELIERRAHSMIDTPEYVATLVCRDAARVVGTLDPATLFPGRNAFAALTATASLWAVGVARPALPAALSPLSHSTATTSAVITRLDVVVTPPAYAGQPTASVHDPARIEALAGSRMAITVHADAGSVTVETLNGRRPLTPSGNGVFVGAVVADADGFIAVEPATTAGRAGVRRLIGLTVTPDHPPRVRIVKPGQDLFLRDANHTIDLAIDASDDLGLASLRLRYTKVSGSGERFTFAEGELPVAVTRSNARVWTAHAQWNLSTLSLAPGDMVVYRAVAADHRPGAVPVESDSFIAELLAPGGDAAAGFALDPDQERYAVSQQMVILKTERLAARRSSMPADEFTTAAQDIGVEQRKVRAEFVFMMGGEVADEPVLGGNMNDLNETAEAEGEADLAAGRMANQGRIALLRAIRSMSRASTALTTADVGPALTHEREALAQLERAFSRTRIILRALTQREALDLTRRLSGTLTDAARDVHPSADPPRDPRVTTLRQALASIATIAGGATHEGASAEISNLAQRVLQVDPSSRPLQDVATLLDRAASAFGAGRAPDARADLDRAATALAGALHSSLLIAPVGTPSVESSLMNGALAGALREARRGR